MGVDSGAPPLPRARGVLESVPALSRTAICRPLHSSLVHDRRGLGLGILRPSSEPLPGRGSALRLRHPFPVGRGNATRVLRLHEQCGRPIRQEQHNEYTSRLVGYPDAHLKVAQFAVPGESRDRSTHDLELVEYVNPRGVRGDTNICNPGAAHLAVCVDDIHERYRRLSAAGVPFIPSPTP